MVRRLDLGGNTTIVVEEGTYLENEAGAVLWDAGLVLIGHLSCHSEGAMTSMIVSIYH